MGVHPNILCTVLVGINSLFSCYAMRNEYEMRETFKTITMKQSGYQKLKAELEAAREKIKELQIKLGTHTTIGALHIDITGYKENGTTKGD